MGAPGTCEVAASYRCVAVAHRHHGAELVEAGAAHEQAQFVEQLAALSGVRRQQRQQVAEATRRRDEVVCSACCVDRRTQLGLRHLPGHDPRPRAGSLDRRTSRDHVVADFPGVGDGAVRPAHGLVGAMREHEQLRQGRLGAGAHVERLALV
nr:hypothetical protein [Acidimicrobiia bacterium]